MLCDAVIWEGWGSADISSCSPTKLFSYTRQINANTCAARNPDLRPHTRPSNVPAGPLCVPAKVTPGAPPELSWFAQNHTVLLTASMDCTYRHFLSWNSSYCEQTEKCSIFSILTEMFIVGQQHLQVLCAAVTGSLESQRQGEIKERALM